MKKYFIILGLMVLGLIVLVVVLNYNQNLQDESISESDKYIAYQHDEYTCKVGETFDTMIRTNEDLATIIDFGSSDTNLATIESGTVSGVSTNCSDCMAVHINCKHKGTVLITATSSTNKETKSIVIID